MIRRGNKLAERGKRSFDTEAVTRAVIKVGEGRGFVMEMTARFNGRIVVTAAHCLPHLPPCHVGAHLEDKTYKNLVGALGSRQRLIWTQCVFADPVADIAVLIAPDNQELLEHCEAFEKFLHTARALCLGEVRQTPIGRRQGNTKGWLLSLAGHWRPCTLTAVQNALWISDAPDGIIGGISGSPILLNDGTAVGVVCAARGPAGRLPTEGGPNPLLSACLPRWLHQRIKKDRTRQGKYR